MEAQETHNNQKLFKTRTKVRDSPQQFQTYYKVTVTKTAQQRSKDGHVVPWKELRVQKLAFVSIDFDKNVKIIQQGKEKSFNSGAGTSEHPMRKNEAEHLPDTIHKN